MTYYLILYVDCEGGKHISHIVENEEVAKQFCRDLNEFEDGYGYSHYICMKREQFFDKLAH